MKYNEKIVSEYGGETVFTGVAPVAYQPKPTGEDYSNGFFIRWFSMRVNELKATEIDPDFSGNIDSNLYKTVSLTWVISGPKNRIVTDGVINKFGIAERNLSEIERVKIEEDVDLSRTLTNPLELWRGY